MARITQPRPEISALDSMLEMNFSNTLEILCCLVHLLHPLLHAGDLTIIIILSVITPSRMMNLFVCNP